MEQNRPYRGRIAPSPSGHLHVGHAQTFYIAKSRAYKFGGKLALRVEDIDIQRCKPHFLPDMVEDLTWFGLTWDEGYGLPGSLDEDFVQSKRFTWYKQAWKILYDQGYIYPCSLSRRDVEHALSAPQDTSNSVSHVDASIATTNSSASSIPSNNIPNEPVLPIELRPEFVRNTPYRSGNHAHFPEKFQNLTDPTQMKINWRFRVPDYASKDIEEANDANIPFEDTSCGTQSFTAMKDFGDFLVWRLDGYPSYELAVVVDDILMRITEVVRGQDLLISTCRQLLLMRAIFQLDFRSPEYWHPIPSVDVNHVDDMDGEKGAIQVENDNSVAPPAQKRARNGTLSTVDMINATQWTYSSSAHPTGSILDYQDQFCIPRYFHAPLMCDENGRRLAKRNFAKSLRKMREEGLTPKEIMDLNFSASLQW